MTETTEMLTAAECETALKRCEAATAGLWEWKITIGRSVEWLVHCGTVLIAMCGSERASNEPNAEFIANARADLPRALATIAEFARLLEGTLGHMEWCRIGTQDGHVDCSCNLAERQAAVSAWLPTQARGRREGLG